MGKIKPYAEKIGKKYLATSVEKKLVLKESRGPATAGYYYSLTDRAPKPGEWTYLTQGFFGIEDLMVYFTLLTNAKDSADGKAALDMLRTMRRHGASEDLE